MEEVHELDFLSVREPIQRPNKINLLPKEILLRIFEEVYSVSSVLDLASPGDLADPRIFPDCLANVCEAWRKLVYSVARFSTRFHIFIDEPVSSTELGAQFQCTKDLPIKVFVVRRDYTVKEDGHEESRVAGVLKLLGRHITRCEVLVLDLLHESSLPHTISFFGNATKLRTLRVQSRVPEHSRKTLEPPSTIPRQVDPFCCPSLRFMDLDCQVFLDLACIPGWAASIRELGQKELIVRGGVGVNLYNFLLCLSKLGHLVFLELANVDFIPGSCFGRNLVTIFVQYFEFEDLSGDSLSSFFDNHVNTIEVSSISLTRCELGATQYLASWFLSLADINPKQDITSFVRHWNGHSLCINNCPGVDDSLLALLSTSQSTRDENTLYAHGLRELQIRTPGLIPITIQALRHMVSVRKLEFERHDARERVDMGSSITLSMVSIYISGLGRRAEETDAKWLRDNLENFTWLAQPIPSDSPILDWDCSQLDSFQFDHLDLDNSAELSPNLHSSQATFGSNQSSVSQLPVHGSPVIQEDLALLEWSVDDLLNIP